jgi:predicted TIM-barrel fold metal-dependent hydrolase
MDDDRERQRLSRRAALRGLGMLSVGAIAAKAASVRAEKMPTSLPAAGAPVDGSKWSSGLHREAESYFVIDGVAHCYNHSESNKRRKGMASKALDVSYAFHAWSTPARFRMSERQYNRDWQPEEVMDVMFLESATDMIVMHSTPIYDAYWDGLISNEKGAYLKEKYPKRVLWYGAVDAFDTLENSRNKIAQLVDQGADGIKFYPTRINLHSNQPENWFMDDEKLAFPLFEYARSKGVRHLATHKVIGYTADTWPALGVNDYYKAAAQFPDITFHIVHGGWTLLEETAELMRQRPNVTAVLEGPLLWPQYDMAAYDEMWAAWMPKVNVDQIIYASTSPNQHPYWIINDFVDYDPPAGRGFRMTREDKAKILGGNLARLHGIDIPTREREIAGDKYSRARAKNGYREPYLMQRTETA